MKKLRAIGNTYPNYIQVVASQASGIKTLADLKGKRISVGAPKSGTELNARAIFKAAGLSYEDMGKVEYLPYAESVELIKNRQLDATLQSSGLGMAAIRDLASTMPITFVAIPADVVAKIDSPAYHAASIPAGTYDGQEQDVPTVAIDNILVSHSGVSDELAYQMTKLMFDNLPRLVTAHAAARTSPWTRRRRTCRFRCIPAPSASTRRRAYCPSEARFSVAPVRAADRVPAFPAVGSRCMSDHQNGLHLEAENWPRALFAVALAFPCSRSSPRPFP